MIVIGFGYRKRVGKDTAAKFLINHLRIKHSGLFIKVVGFADKLKDVCFQLYSWDGLMPGEFYECSANAHLRDVPLPTIKKSPRQIWIEFGTHVGREVYQETWTEYAVRSSPCDVLIFKDVRFHNEVNTVKRHGGITVNIINPNIPETDDLADRQLKDFADWDVRLINDKGLKEFHQVVTEFANTIDLSKKDNLGVTK